MKIYLDDLVFSIQKVGGISVFWSGFLKIINSATSEKVCLIRESSPKNILAAFAWDKDEVDDLKIPISFLRVLPLLKKLSPKSIFHSSYLRVSMQKDVCNIVTIHDLAAEDRMINGIHRYLKLALQSFAIKKADGIICVSATTRKSLLSHYPKLKESKVKTILHGCSDKFFPVKQHTESPRKKLILFVGGRGVYKNFATCLKVMETLKDYHLVMVGGGNLSVEEQMKMNEAMPERYEHYDELDTFSLNLLYNKAHCLFYPTVYEGFGLPILEAMSAGCPIVSSDIPAINEVAKEAAVLIKNPYHVQPFVDAIISLEDKNFRNDLIAKGLKRAKGFSLETQYSETIAFYQEIYSQKFGL